MKLFFKFTLAFFVAITLCTFTAFANNNVSSINISVVLNNDGSANITQFWEGSFNEGTENYFPIENLGEMTLSDFSVSDANGKFTYEQNWDIDENFSQKARKCGIVKTDNGYELCFGISKYGKNSYSIEYKINGLVGSYSDYDGFNFMFINRNMSTFPTDGKIEIFLQDGTKLDSTNSAIWSFGYVGNIEFQDGNVVANTQNSLEGSDSMIVLLRLNKGILFPERIENSTFEELKSKAIENSNYESGKSNIFRWIFIIIVSVIALFIFFAIYKAIKRKKALKKFYKECNYFRDVPNKGNLEISYFLSKTFDIFADESAIIGASMLQLINNNNLEPQTTENVGFMGKTKTSVELKLVSEPQDNLLLKLYRILEASCGQDRILQEKELEKYCKSKPKELRTFIDTSFSNGSNAFSAESPYLKLMGNSPENLNDVGVKELSEIMGMKKYLLEFSLISEREIKEVVIWKEYLVYATLLGIADVVMEQFKKVYPQYIAEFDNYQQNVYIAYSYNHLIYNAMHNAEQAARSSGMGGSSSHSGGGGFSGGGSGGGSR